MEPINSNLFSNTCPEITSSNCVSWSGPNIACLSICRGASITDVIYALSQQVCGTPGVPCYTGSWVYFGSSIPLTGTDTASGTSWNITTFGGAFGPATNFENSPHYRWSKTGNLEVKGSMSITITPVGAYSGVLQIPLVTLPSACLPAGLDASQSAIIGSAVVNINPNQITAITQSYLTLDYPTGTLFLDIEYVQAGVPFPNVVTFNIFMGGTTFNI